MRTALYDEIVKLNGKMVDFHGWDMPIQFTSIIEEHKHVRSGVGLFDVSHMGDISIEGKDAEKFLLNLFPTDISKADIGKAVYSAYLNPDANMIDDTIIYKQSKDRYLVVPNAATTSIIYNWLTDHGTQYDVKVTNLSDKLSCLALQGPDAPSIMEHFIPEANDLDKFTFISASASFPDPELETATVIGRTGYTGEDGFEFIVPNKHAPKLWRDILNHEEVKPVGLGARDTLRMEKGFLLSGQDFNEDRNPIEAAASWIIDWDHEFIGKEKLLEKKENIEERFRGVVALDRTIPRSGSIIKIGDENVGALTSGTFSPSLGKGIGLGFVSSKVKVNTEVTVVTKTGEGKGLLKKPRIL